MNEIVQVVYDVTLPLARVCCLTHFVVVVGYLRGSDVVVGRVQLGVSAGRSCGEQDGHPDHLQRKCRLKIV